MTSLLSHYLGGVRKLAAGPDAGLDQRSTPFKDNLRVTPNKGNRKFSKSAVTENPPGFTSGDGLRNALNASVISSIKNQVNILTSLFNSAASSVS